MYRPWMENVKFEDLEFGWTYFLLRPWMGTVVFEAPDGNSYGFKVIFEAMDGKLIVKFEALEH